MTTEVIQYKVLTSTDLNEVTKLMNEQFLPRNPLAICAGETKFDDFTGKDLLNPLDKCVKSGVSWGAYTSSGRLVGFRLASIATPTEQEEHCGSHSKCLKVLAQMKNSIDLFKQKDVQKILDMFAVTVHQDYSGQGIASNLIKKTIALAEEKGCQLAATDITNTLSGKIYNRLGFQTEATLDLNTVPGLKTSLIPPEETMMYYMVGRLPLSV